LEMSGVIEGVGSDLEGNYELETYTTHATKLAERIYEDLWNGR
jgi:hypothetical protein